MRKFPAPGFYALKSSPDKTSVIYVTGTTKGNKYRDTENHGNSWNDLTWTCVPSIKRASEEYDFHAENPTSLPLP